ncbi:hypothetical protein [Paracraurococcus ruber]|uniref:Uncharacterized protein n=1 Tax=Paracraurococcus ruber TaxID=77675 RepID=A0ABS1D5J9_9PROT|nr:hypothetical protein [Paracraurococcus ruber]MBK1661773.1 hypothetical protein [Paracraurococcus ruber]TDG18671.1 hypothetical protein E2C05_27995 [Paracraurococcus ruber]
MSLDLATATLGDLADLRIVLELAQQRAQQREAAERQQAAADATHAVEEAFRAEVDALVAPGMPAVVEARHALDEARARARADAARQAVEVAQEAVTAARAALPALVDRAVAGKTVGADLVGAAYAGVTRAEQHAGFLATVAGRYAALVPPAEAALKAAIAEAHEPVYQRGVALRIEGAAAADAAQNNIPTLGNRAGLDAARLVFEYGTRFLRYAADRSVPIRSRAGGISDYWPARERTERRTWGVPAPGETP